MPDPSFGGIEAFGSVLFTDTLVPFEISSGLLMVAVVGAVAVARGRQGSHTMSPGEQEVGRRAPTVDPKRALHPSGVFSHDLPSEDAKGHAS